MVTRVKSTLRKVSRGFQITLPPEFRRQTGLVVGDHVRMEQEGDRLIITPVSDHRQQLAGELVAALSEPVEGGDFADDKEALRFAIDQVRQFRAGRKKQSMPET